MENLDGRLVIGVSSRALFDLEAENEIFENMALPVIVNIRKNTKTSRLNAEQPFIS